MDQDLYHSLEDNVTKFEAKLKVLWEWITEQKSTLVKLATRLTGACQKSAVLNSCTHLLVNTIHRHNLAIL